MPNSRGFSLASVLLLTAIVAVYAAAIRMGLVYSRPDGTLLGLAIGSGTVVGLVAGGYIGSREGLPRGWLLGLLAGAIFGPASGALLVLPWAVPAVLAGAVIVILFTLVIRRLSARPG